MGTTAEKLAKLIQTKSEIKQAIIDKGVSVSDNTPFGMYASKIAEIPTGGEFQDFWYEYGNKTLSYLSTRASSMSVSTFLGFTNLSYISVPNLLTFGYSAMFSSCTALTSVYAPNVWYINNYCFYGCTSLSEIHLPALTRIGSSVFSKCTNLKSVYLDTLPKIGGSMFTSMSGLETVYMPSAGMQMPSNGLSDGNNAYQFSGCYSLTNLTLDWSRVTCIPMAAFQSCSNLSTLDLRYVSQVSNNAFWECRKLKTVSLNSIEVLNAKTFSFCYSLSSIGYLNNCSIIECDEMGFYSCQMLSGVMSGSNMKKVWYSNSGTAYAWYVFPSERTREGYITFNFPNLYIAANMAMPTMDANNFGYVSNAGNSHYICVGSTSNGAGQTLSLSNVVILDTKYTGGSFKGFASYAQIIDTTSTIRTISPMASSGYSNPTATAFNNTSAFSLPALEYIGHGAMYATTGLSSFYAPNLKYVGNNNFTSSCPAVVSRNGLRQIEYDTGKYFTCGNAGGQTATVDLSGVHIIAGKQTSSTWTFNAAVTSLVNTDNIEFVGASTFVNNTRFTSLSLPNLKAIDTGGFRGMTALQTLYAPMLPSPSLFCFSNNPSFPIMDEQLPIGCFSSCSSLSSVTLNWSALTEIPEAAFSGCMSLVVDLDLPNVTKVSKHAFYYCSKITKLNLPECTEAGYYAFAYINNMTEINMPKLVDKYPGAILFENTGNRTYLSSVNLPLYSGRIVGQYGLLAGAPLVYLNVANANTNDYPGSGIMAVNLITSSARSTLRYLNVDNWTGLSGSTGISYCSVLSEVHATNVKYLGNYTFSGCYQLSNISLPNCIEIGQWAFNNCSALSELSLPECRSFASYAMNNCRSLRTVWAEKVERIYNAAFAGYTSGLTDFYPNVSSVPWLEKSAVQIFSNPYPTIHIKSSMWDAYLASSYWAQLSSKFVSY